MNADEEYLISQILNSLKTDAAAAKCWMIFAKSAFPHSFAVLFQCYKMECEEKNLVESSNCLSDLIKKFPSEPLLVKDLRSMAKALCSESDLFLRQIFEQLPEEVKYDVMLAVTRNAHTVEEHCELMLLFLKRMPNARLHQHASNIVDTLLTAEERPGTLIPINLFRKMLVCDALPLILRGSQFDYKFKVIFQLLQKALEFYVCCMFTNPTAQEAVIRKEVMSESNPSEGWKPLLKLLETVAVRYRWNYPEMFVSNFSELSLQQLISLLRRKNKTIASLVVEKHRREDLSGFEEAYFCLVITFFYYLYRYGCLVLPKMPSNAMTGPFNYFLIEGISMSQESCPKVLGTEFKRTEKGHIAVGKFAPAEVSGMLAPSFVTAVECWDMLQRHSHLSKEFSSLAKNVQLELWPIYQEFYIDMLIYMKHHDKAIEHLRNGQGSSTDLAIRNKAALQIAGCYYYLGDYESSLKILFEVIINLPASTAGPSKLNIGKCPGRYTYFMGYNNRDILQYCVSLLLKLYKCKDKLDDIYKDMYLGFTLVLIQYDMEHEYGLLKKVTELIKKSKTFSFSKFFNYIINVDILEEISYLSTPAGGNVNLEILSTPTFQASKQRAVTRGVNKGARDDLRQAFVNQMARCYDNIDNLFIEFIKEEHNFLLLPLSDS